MHSDLPPTPMDADPFRLVLPYLDIPDVKTLQFIMQVEAHAVQVVHQKANELNRPGVNLVDPTGRPVLEVAQQLHEELTKYLKSLLLHITIAEEWAGAPSFTSKIGAVTTTSFQIAYLTYQELARMIQKVCPEFVSVVDAAAVIGMNALHHDRDPHEGYIRGIQAKAETAEGLPVLGQEEAFKQRLFLLETVLLRFLGAKGMLEAPAPDTRPHLTMEGVKLLQHLMASLGSTKSITDQAPALADMAMNQNQAGETLAGAQILSELEQLDQQLEDPNAILPEA